VSGLSEELRARIAASRAASREIARRWLEGAEYRALGRAFLDCPLDRAEPAVERAEQLLADPGWAEALLEPLLVALGRDPLFEPPFKVSRDAFRIGALLFDCPAVALVANVTHATAMPAPATILFTGHVAVTRHIRTGSATLQRWEAEPVDVRFSTGSAAPARPLPSATLGQGDVRRLDGRIEAQFATGARSDMVTLTATIRPGAAPLMREYAIANGALVRIASTDERAARTEMLLAFLRLSRRADAAACFEAATHEPAFHLRWAAMREWLALDARAALPRLAEMAHSDANAEIRAAATLTLVAVERRLEEVRCPA
jgi:hypothetical protein